MRPIRLRVRRLAALGRDRRAATAVELALTAPFLILAVLMIIENGLMMFAQSALETATYEAARQIQIGNITSQSAFQNAVCSYTSTLFNCSKLNIYVASNANAFPSSVKPLPNGAFASSSFSTGGRNAFVIAEVAYNRAYVSPWLISLGSGWTLLSVAAFQNEPQT